MQLVGMLDLVMKWHEKLQLARINSGDSQFDAAAKLKVSQSNISRIENGGLPSVELLVGFAEVYDLSLDWVFDERRRETLEEDREFRRLIRDLGGPWAARRRMLGIKISPEENELLKEIASSTIPVVRRQLMASETHVGQIEEDGPRQPRPRRGPKKKPTETAPKPKASDKDLHGHKKRS